MSVALVLRTFPLRLLVVALAAAAGVLATGLTGALPALPAVALAAGLGAALPTVALVWLALAIHRTTRSFGACRGSGFLGMGVLAGAVTAAALPRLPVGLRPVVALGGLVVTAGLFLLGLLLLPGIATTAVARLRRGFDGLGIGLSLSLLGWVTLPTVGAAHAYGYAVVTVVAACLSVTTVTVLRATRHRPAARYCGAGAGLAVVGLGALALAVEARAPGEAVLLAGVPLAAGPVLSWLGARRTGTIAAVHPADGDGSLAAHPMLALPVGAAVLATAYHLAVVGPLDRTAVVLALAVGSVLVLREILAAADVRRYARRLAHQEAHFRALVTGSSDVTMVLCEDLVVRWQSPGAARRLGLLDRDVLGRPFVDLVHPDDVASVADQLRAIVSRRPGGAEPVPDDALAGGREGGAAPALIVARLIDGAGSTRETESTVSDQRDAPAVGALVVHVRDVGERRRLERSLHRLTRTDQLTGVANRAEFLRVARDRRAARGRPAALLVVGLHGVSAINDLRGRQVGDAVLVEAALRLRGQVGPDDAVGRLGGGEFALLTLDGPVEAYALGARVLSVLAPPYQLPGGAVQLDASVGLTELVAEEDAEEAVRRADLALHRADQLGRNRIEWFDESLEEQLLRRMDLERELPGAAGRGELDLVFQPMVDLADGRTVGVEALLRWRHPVLGTVLPGEFVPVADRLAVGGEIAQWVWQVGCRQLARWRELGHELWLAINVSGRQLGGAGFVTVATAALRAHRIRPERVCVEIAEAEIGDDAATVITQLGRLRVLGVRTAVDDFGAGHVPLAQLRRLPVDLVKIESGIFAPPPGRPPTPPVVAAVVDLARRLGVAVVAEGVETPAQLDLVRGAGCRYGQGYLWARPGPAERLEAYLETHRSASR